MAIAEQAYLAYSKKLLVGEYEKVKTNLGLMSEGFKTINTEGINIFLPKLLLSIETLS